MVPGIDCLISVSTILRLPAVRPSFPSCGIHINLLPHLSLDTVQTTEQADHIMPLLHEDHLASTFRMDPEARINMPSASVHIAH